MFPFAFQVSQFLSDVGGTLGLYIGASVLSVCEVVDFLLTLCCGALMAKRQKQPVIRSANRTHRTSNLNHQTQLSNTGNFFLWQHWWRRFKDNGNHFVQFRSRFIAPFGMRGTTECEVIEGQNPDWSLCQDTCSVHKEVQINLGCERLWVAILLDAVELKSQQTLSLSNNYLENQARYSWCSKWERAFNRDISNTVRLECFSA